MSDVLGNSPDSKNKGVLSHLWKLALAVSVLAIAANLVIMFGARLGFWAPLDGMGLYRTYFNPIAFVAAGLGLVVLVIHLVRKERAGSLLSGIAFLMGAVMLLPWLFATIDPPVRAPPIHDITTDTQNPPEFQVLDETRAGASNSLDYSGQETADAQLSAYPDIAPVITTMTAEDAFERALSVAETMNWEIIPPTFDSLRFEATARTPVFYFADDIVVVVTPLDDGSRVDLRSVSRVGRSDQGVNAARIRAFVSAFSQS
ncbi:DUF1499 domain-containing protein [Yoonia sp. I 8.24]|uniref:DUF1499 domain-containing protein n=1 Tax=Yoonia sp. I 8.24 TaxID=1537229 RepID=UPI001EE02A5B|nr:DUF1499 domain-containing protein [Yoonia sp. I 8.24]MCG3268210.1 DUF1499 domain-containing protein [Yoonia sp. I 8.24]